MVDEIPRRPGSSYGRDAVGVISTGQLVTEEFYTLGKLVQLGLGTRNYDGNTTLCMATAVSGYKRSFGSDGPPGAYEDLERADVVLLIGANIADNHPILWQRLEANRGKTLIVADPRVTKTAMLADLHLPVKPRSDLALLNGIDHILIEHDLIDREYIAAHTTGFDALRESVRDVHAGARRRDHRPVRRADLPDGVRSTATRAPAFIGWTMGVNHSTKGTETVNAINNLALITGNIGRAGASPFSITGQCNAMGTREAGFASSLPGYRKFESADDREELAALWSVPVDRAFRPRAAWPIPTSSRRRSTEEDPRALDHRDQSDRLVPEPRRADAGARDARLPRRAGRLSSDADDASSRDLVLPAAIWGEKEGTYTNSERRVSKVNEAVDAAGRGALRFRHLPRARRRRSAAATSCSRAGRRREDAFDEWRRVSAGRLCDYSGMTYEADRSSTAACSGRFPTARRDPAATRRLYADGQFPDRRTARRG